MPLLAKLAKGWPYCAGLAVSIWLNSNSPLARLLVMVGMPSNRATAPTLKVWLPLIQVALALNVGFTSSWEGASKNEAVLLVGNGPPPVNPKKPNAEASNPDKYGKFFPGKGAPCGYNEDWSYVGVTEGLVVYCRPPPKCNNRVGVRVSSRLMRTVCAKESWTAAVLNACGKPLVWGENVLVTE